MLSKYIQILKCTSPECSLKLLRGWATDLTCSLNESEEELCPDFEARKKDELCQEFNFFVGLRSNQVGGKTKLEGNGEIQATTARIYQFRGSGKAL